MAKIDVNRTELVWPGKYNEDGTLKEVPRVSLPFQVIETVNESRATREAKKGGVQGGLFDVYEGKEGDTFEAGWRNKLIWGDNLLVMGSLLEKFAGKIDLIYIDPPFATGADFSFTAEIGESGEELTKEQSAIEEKAYRDTWGRGLESYIHVMYERVMLMRDLLSDRGSLLVHCDTRMNSHLRLLLDEIFASSSFINQITWRRTGAHNDPGRYGMISDTLLYYSKTEEYCWNQAYGERSEAAVETSFCYAEKPDGSYVRLSKDQSVPKNWRRFQSVTLRSPHPRPNLTYDYKGYKPHRNGWSINRVRMEQYDRENRLLFPESKDGAIRLKMYLDESPGVPVQDIWTDVGKVEAISKENLGYATQKPEALLERIINVSSNSGDLVADFFCGSGTTLAVAEKLGRRWIGCDLGRWATHVTRKRLLGIENCKPFEVLNLGKYERQYWQGVTFGKAKDKPFAEQTLYEYLAFILKLYGAQPVAGLTQLHGKKGKAMVHIGAVDAPVTISEIDMALDECAKLKQSDLHVLGWEWEMGLYDLMVEVAKKRGVRLLLLIIPREVMEQQAAAKGDVRFFELAYLEAEIKQPKKLTARVTLKDFVIPNTELIPEEVRSKVKKWSDFIDYWSVDWDFQNDTFMQGWVAYRTRKERALPLTCDPHTYDKAGKYRILVKVIDIFGNDTSQAFDVEVK
jgi:adenine-specific DNA-methyltransferase